MEVKLIAQTNDPVEVMWTAARTCYNSKSPVEMWEDLENNSRQVAWEHRDDEDKSKLLEDIRDNTDKRWKLVTKVLDSGHQSVAEHVYFTFAIEGISRACSHQLVRHRAGIVFSQQSQRYVEIKENVNRLKDILLILTPGSDYNLEDMARVEKEVTPILNKYFVEVSDTNIYAYLQSLINYLSAINMGTKAEDARNFLPNATKTNITMSVNLRELIHLCNLRLCCFDDKTEILTNQGWKYFKDLNGEELFYSLNPNSHYAELISCKKIINEDYSGDMISIESQAISLNTTPNHKMYCSYSYDNKKFDLDYTFNHNNHKTILMKKNCKGIKGEIKDTFTLKGFIREDSNQYTSWQELMPDREVPIKEFLEFLGFYISDGCCSHVNNHYMIILSKGDKNLLEKYQQILTKLSPNSSQIFPEGNAWKLQIHDRYLYEYLKHLGKVLDKHIPEELFNLDSSLLINLFIGLMDGDANKQCTLYWTSSNKLKDDFQRLCLHIGYSSTCTIVDNRGKKRTIKGKKEEHSFIEKNISYCLSINKKQNEPIIKTTNRNAFTSSFYEGRVYCVELEKNNIVYVRRNGKCVWSGNSRAQKEIRELFKLIKAEVVNVQPRLAKYLVPTCEINGICYEHQCCGRKPHIDEVMAVYNAFKDDYISKEDYEQLQQSIKNPKVNQKLKKLMEMESVIE